MAHPFGTGGSMFFFEKKNQKTFANYPPCGQAAASSVNT
jgi:hypothetical protein